MVFHGPDYVLGQYQEWFASLVGKNSENADSIAQNISLLGLVHRVSGYWFNDLWLIVPGLVLFGLPYLRFAQYKHVAFRQTLLASVLMFVVLFSTGSESSGYIIPFVGIVVWYTAAPWKRNSWDVALLVFAFVLSSLSPSDLFPAYVRREWVQPYALKALPVVLIWLKLCYEMLTRDYSSHSHAEEEKNYSHTEDEKYYFHTEAPRKKSETPASFNSAPLCENNQSAPLCEKIHSVTLHKILRSETFGEMVRFAIVGTTAAAIHYAIYWVLQHWINVNVAYTIGYVLSFLVNYYLSAHFTFREHTSARNGVGFGGAHLMNYLLHMVLFNFFLWIGLSRELAPIAVLAIAVPANFLMVRFVFKHFKRK
jgi:putative flippase GtrA